MCPNAEFFLVPIFPHSDWIRRNTEYLSVFNLNVGKYGPGKTPYLDIFHALILIILFETQKQPLVVFYKKAVLWNFAIFIGKHLCWKPFLNKVPACNLFSKRLKHKCFSVNISKFLRTPMFVGTPYKNTKMPYFHQVLIAALWTTIIFVWLFSNHIQLRMRINHTYYLMPINYNFLLHSCA